MNSTGLELTQTDKIRNFTLMGLDTQLQTDLYKEFWRRMELDFGQEAYSPRRTRFDSFMRDYLTVKTCVIPKVNAVYDTFKAYAVSPTVAADGVESLVADIRQFARYF